MKKSQNLHIWQPWKIQVASSTRASVVIIQVSSQCPAGKCDTSYEVRKKYWSSTHSPFSILSCRNCTDGRISEISFLFQILISWEMKPAEYVLSFLLGLKFREIFFSLWWYRTICTIERRARNMGLMRQPKQKARSEPMGPFIGMISMGGQFFSLYTFWNMIYATLSLDIWIDNFVKPFLLWLHDKHVAVK